MGRHCCSLCEKVKLSIFQLFQFTVINDQFSASWWKLWGAAYGRLSWGTGIGRWFFDCSDCWFWNLPDEGFDSDKYIYRSDIWQLIFLLAGPRQVGMRGAWWWSTWSSTPTSPTTRTTWVTFYKQHILGHICIQINKTMNHPLPALLKLPRPAPSSLAPLCLPPPSTDNLLGLRYFLELIDFFSFDYSILDKRTDVAKNIDF